MYASPFFVKGFSFESNIFMAPLAGITDKAFRAFLRCFKPGFMFTEMVPLPALFHRASLLEDYIDLPVEAKDTGIQIIGNNPEWFEGIAIELEKRGLKWLDINCGCSVPKVLKQKHGAYLMREPERCRQIFRAIRNSFSGICSVKIRAGWDRSSLNYLRISEIAFEEGLDVVFFHPRTARERFSSPAEWQWVKNLKMAFPQKYIFGNGDLFTEEDVQQKWQYSEVNGMLLARGAMKAPWFFSCIRRYLRGENPPPPSLQQRLEYLMVHMDCLIEKKGERKGVKEMRKFMGWYLSGMYGVKKLRRYLPGMKTRKDVVRFIQIVYNMHLIS